MIEADMRCVASNPDHWMPLDDQLNIDEYIIL